MRQPLITKGWALEQDNVQSAWENDHTLTLLLAQGEKILLL